MTNSLTIFLTTLPFIAFGYASIVRMAYKQSYSATNKVDGTIMSNLSQLISRIGQGAIFTCLFATSLLLFWGWGIALLWLIAFHLFVETFVNIQISQSNSTTKPNFEKIALPTFIWRIYLLLLASIIISLLVSLIHKQSGTVFFLAALLPAHLLLRNSYTGRLSIVSFAFAFLMLLLGLMLSDKLGFSIYNSFEPLKNFITPNISANYFAWLNFNNISIITSGLIIAAFSLCSRKALRNDMSNISGALLLIILCVFIVKLAWLRPIIDAPLIITEPTNSNLPNFAALSLFLFSGLSLLLFREEEKAPPKAPIHLRSITDSLNNKQDTSNNFFNLQLSNFIQLLLNTLIVIILACALGIGAWNTHYADWNSTATITAHFDLTLNAMLDLLNPRADTSSQLYNILLTGIIFCGFALLLNILSKLIQLNDNTNHELEPRIKQLCRSNATQGIIIYIASCLFINTGISIELWLVIGMLAWLLICSLMLEYALDNEHNENNNKVQNGFLFALIASGSLQILWNLVGWVTSSNYIYALMAGLILILAIKSWKNQLPELLNTFKKTNDEKLFD